MNLVYSSTIYNSQDMKAAYVSINRGTDKNVVHTHGGVLLSYKKEGKILQFSAKWMDL